MIKKKILITGGLGYVGTEILYLLSPKDNDITIIDSNFNPFLIKKCIEYGAKFIHTDIFNIKKQLDNCDVCFHLAGITDVPQTVAKSNPIIDAEITRIGTEGTRFIIKNINKASKVIFASTQVVYDGLSETVFNIDEKYPPKPSVAYSKSKHQSELDLFNSDINFLITRFASVYGYNDAIRWKILPNLFSKMASQNQNLTVFGGSNLKPLIGINDLAKSLLFLDQSEYNKEVFHCANENITVREIANICKKYSNIEIIETNEEAPNKGFSLSNKKLLETGFIFQQTINNEIQKMIQLWQNK